MSQTRYGELDANKVKVKLLRVLDGVPVLPASAAAAKSASMSALSLATNMIWNKLCRKALPQRPFNRLNSSSCASPPLRERPDDIEARA